MNRRQIDPEVLASDDEFVNDLAIYWYFLTLHFNATGGRQLELMTDELIDRGIQLKKYLRQGGFTYLQPMNVCVDTDTFFDVWMDADGDIQVSELYTDAD